MSKDRGFRRAILMKFLQVDHNSNGEPLNKNRHDYNSSCYWWGRYVRLDQFSEFIIVDNQAVGSDMNFFVCGVLPNEPREFMWDNCLASFGSNELDKAKEFVEKLISELNGKNNG